MKKYFSSLHYGSQKYNKHENRERESGYRTQAIVRESGVRAYRLG